jgi:hypothetical protein
MIGKTLGRYEITGQLGKGGRGKVWLLPIHLTVGFMLHKR